MPLKCLSFLCFFSHFFRTQIISTQTVSTAASVTSKLIEPTTCENRNVYRFSISARCTSFHAHISRLRTIFQLEADEVCENHNNVGPPAMRRFFAELGNFVRFRRLKLGIEIMLLFNKLRKFKFVALPPKLSLLLYCMLWLNHISPTKQRKFNVVTREQELEKGVQTFLHLRNGKSYYSLFLSFHYIQAVGSLRNSRKLLTGFGKVMSVVSASVRLFKALSCK